MTDLDINVIVDRYCITIQNSYTVDKRRIMNDVLNDLRKSFSVPVLNNRSNIGMIFEWVAHNNLYKLHICRNHTKNVDLEYPQKWYYKLAWFLLGIIKI